MYIMNYLDKINGPRSIQSTVSVTTSINARVQGTEASVPAHLLYSGDFGARGTNLLDYPPDNSLGPQARMSDLMVETLVFLKCNSNM